MAQKIDVLAHLGCGGLLGKCGGLELVAHLRCGDSNRNEGVVAHWGYGGLRGECDGSIKDEVAQKMSWVKYKNPILSAIK